MMNPIKFHIRCFAILLLMVSLLVTGSDARRKVVISPRDLLFVGFEVSGKNRTDEIRKINNLFLTKLKAEAGKKIHIRDLSEPYIFSKERDVLNLGKSHGARWVLNGKIRFYHSGDYRITATLSDVIRCKKRAHIYTRRSKLTAKNSALKAGKILEVIAETNNYFFAKKRTRRQRKKKSLHNAYRTIALLNLRHAAGIPGAFKKIDTDLARIMRKFNKKGLRSIERKKLYYCQLPGSERLNRKKLSRISRASGADWIISGYIYPSKDPRGFKTIISLFHGPTGRKVLHIQALKDSAAATARDLTVKASSLIVTISQSRHYFLHRESPFTCSADFSHFGHSTLSTRYTLPYGVHCHENKIIASTFDRAALMDKNGKLLATMGSRGTGEGSFQYPSRIDTDKKGHIYILDTLGRKVLIFNSEGKFLQEFYFQVRSPRDFSVSPGGSIFIPDYRSSRLCIYDTGGRLRAAPSFPAGAMQGMVKNPKGAVILLVENGFYSLCFLSESGKILKKQWLSLGRTQFYLSGGVLDHKGRFYSWDLQKNLVLGTGTDGQLDWIKNRLRGLKKPFFNMPCDLSVKPDGSGIFVVDMQNRRIVSLIRYRPPRRKQRASWYYSRSLKADFPLAFALLNCAIDRSPRYITALLRRGRLYASSGHHRRAINEYRQVLAINRNSKSARRALKKSLLALKLSEAGYFSEKFNKALKTGPESARPFYEMAVKAYEEALAIDGKDSRVRNEYQSLVKSFKKARGRDSLPAAQVSSIAIRDIFSSLYKSYADNPFGTITVKNSTGAVIDRIYATIRIRGFMDYPTETRARRNIAPGESVSLKIFAVFNNKILSLSEDTPLNARIVVHYTGSSGRKTLVSSHSFTVYNRNAMTWDDTKKLASYITPRESTVKSTARHIIQSFRHCRLSFLDARLQKAMQVFASLGSYGITYVEDPKTPYKKFSNLRGKVDYIQYPRETLKYRTGDCDDLTVMFSSLLENLGIDTAFVTVPGHIFLMFNTGVPQTGYTSVSHSRKLLVFHEGTVWVPVETTLMGESFLEAWNKGAVSYRKHKNNGTIEIFKTEHAWQSYAPATLDDSAWEPKLPPLEMIQKIYNRDINRLIESELTSRLSRLKAKLETNPKDHRVCNSIGVTYARYEKFSEGERYFQRAMKNNPRYASPLINMGNIYLLQKKNRQAIQMYREAAKLAPSNARLRMNMALAYNALNMTEKAETEYRRAVTLDSSLKGPYAWLLRGKAVAETRADRPKRQLRILWSE